MGLIYIVMSTVACLITVYCQVREHLACGKSVNPEQKLFTSDLLSHDLSKREVLSAARHTTDY